MQLTCVGDLGIIIEENTAAPWQLTSALVREEGKRLLFNWEIPMGEKVNHRERSSGPRIITSGTAVEKIKEWAPSYAALSNNHILDAGEEGLNDTIAHLQRSGFVTFGAGTAPEIIAQPLLWETEQGCLAVLNWVFPETHPEWNKIPGPNCWPGLAEATKIVRGLKKQVDWVLVYPHWSDESFPYPKQSDRQTAHALIEAGADMIVGHHPHVVRGYELINRKPVFYSLGNFYFSEKRDDQGNWLFKPAPRNREALALQLTFCRGKDISYQTFSFWQNSSQTQPDPWNRAERRLRNTSKILSKLADEEYSRWYIRRRKIFDRLDYRIHFSLYYKGWTGIFRYPFTLTNRWMKKDKS